MGKSLDGNHVEAMLRHPLLQRLCVMASKLSGLGLLVVFPKADGWGQVPLGPSRCVPSFCRAVQQSRNGARHCKMCHILMTVSACSGREAVEQTCHAGAYALTAPVPISSQESFAIVSSCLFAHAGAPAGWRDIRERSRKLGVDMEVLRTAYDELPRLTNAEMSAARDIMAATAEAVGILADRAGAEQQLAELRQTRKPGALLRDTLERELRARPAGHVDGLPPANGNGGNMPAVVRVAATVVDQRPNMPFSVAEIAAAARISPNHFSSLFRKHQGQSFSAYLTQKRIDLAREVLCDLTLNITEVAQQVGYDDPGSFARRFKQRTGMSPGEWRATRTAGVPVADVSSQRPRTGKGSAAGGAKRRRTTRR